MAVFGSDLPKPLPLAAAIKSAQSNNFAIKRARARVRERGGELKHASRLLPSNPELQVQTGTETKKSTDEEADTLGIRVSQEFWVAGQGELREEAAKSALEAARSELEFLRASVTARVRGAFLEVLVARREQRTAERLLEITKRNRAIAQRRLDAGDTNVMTLNATKVSVGRAHAAVAQAEARVQRARLRVARLLSVQPQDMPELAGEISPIELELPEIGKLVAKAARRRQDLKAASKRVQAARTELDLSRREVIPNLKVFGFTREIDGREEESGVGIGVELPLFHQRSGENQAAQARVEQAQHARDALLLEVRTNVRGAASDYRGARQRVAALREDGLANAQRNVDLLGDSYAEGKVGIQAVVSGQRQLFDVRDDYLQALEDLVQAATELERVTGGLIAVQSGVDKTSTSGDEQ